ncbi:MAG: HAMP domain-containing histidine kinase [Oscillospiraceae bacterium]|nr:HAMP domain-containing histidine kinase [Oscillospiraceae bacterium]
MSAVTILLLVLVGAINGFNWMILERQSDNVLHTLVNADGKFMHMDFHNQPPLAPPLNMDIMKSARFFIVLTDEKGRVIDVNIDQISSVSTEAAEQYAKQVNENAGRIDGYKYEVKTFGTERLIFFLDTSGQRNTFITVLIVSSAIALVCWLAILLFAILVSNRIVRPIIAGMEKQKQFITNAGHELKTPLAIIQSNNDAMMLIHGENKYNNNIRLQTQRLNTLMTNLLTLSKLDEEVKLPTESVNISELITLMLPPYDDAAASRQISFSTNIMSGVYMQIHKDTFVQMITVLLDNAVKYTPEGGTILFSLLYENNHVWLVEENSCEQSQKINPERLFERFYRGDDARTQSATVSGYGIGLSAARAIAETFGGKLTAEYVKQGRIRFTARF